MEKKTWLQWGLVVVLAFSAGRFSLFGGMYPCGVALLAVMIRGKERNLYLVPLILLGLLSAGIGKAALIANGGVVIVAAIIFTVLREYKLAMATKALIGSGVLLAVKVIGTLRLHIFYLYGWEQLIAEAFLVIYFSYIFFKMICFIGLKKLPLKNPESIIVLITVTLIACQGIPGAVVGFLPEAMNQFYPTEIAAFFLTLFIGYRVGIKEGAMAGAVAGFLLTGTNPAAASLMGILTCGGMMAGLCKAESKLLAAAGFGAVTLFFGLAKDAPALYFPIYEPLLASALFLVIPIAVARKILPFLETEEGEAGGNYNLKVRQNVMKTLDQYQQTFQYLSRAYVLNREPLSADPDVRNGRLVMAYQFKGMADAIEKIKWEISVPANLPVKRENRFQIRMGKAGYAKEGKISGDSVLCTEVRRGLYMAALSDGMGNGRKAAEESNLTVQTISRLLAAGFSPELSLKIMNSILLFKSTEEIYSTLDLGLINLLSGEMRLYKIGAAATLIKRGTQVEALKIPALPMGIIGDIPIQYLEHQLRRGDLIIILSDGITEAGRGQDLQWLKETVIAIKSSDPQTVADLIINKAVERHGLKEKDDMTAVIIAVQ